MPDEPFSISIARHPAYYANSASAFIASSAEVVIGTLASKSGFAIELTQRDAWIKQITILQDAVTDIDGTVFLEFSVPRIGSRLDAVLISGDTIFAIEFKVGESRYLRDHLNQVWDYALDLKNFHKGSHQAPIVPILVATEAEWSDKDLPVPHPDLVYPPSRCNGEGLGELIKRRLLGVSTSTIDAAEWSRSRYQPTPTIIQAAQALYSQHSVEEISRHDAGAQNLAVTSQRVETLIEQARTNNQKVIIFVTGVPGAGKTLVGLDVATKKRDKTRATHAVFLSGNGPLVDVLREGLARDEMKRLRQVGTATRRGETRQRVKAFIQNVHHFRDEGLRTGDPPVDHVVIFDEAQRAWNQRKTAQFMARKKGRVGFSQSEPQFLISYLDRHSDWSVVVCLVGGGQEINDGEAGIAAWLEAIREHFPEWRVHISTELTDSEYAADVAMKQLRQRNNVVTDSALHLAVSMRSFRAETLSRFVKCVLDCEEQEARSLLKDLSARYPIALTRQIGLAKKWVRAKARGTERYGIVASSSAQRLKPHAIDVRVSIDPVHWFLNGTEDTRSSWYLEDAATEFQIQGLELDWVCMTWDADLRFNDAGWSFNSFRGTRWNSVRALDRRRYLLNAYRVLLTRARQGMVIFVPEGDDGDATRTPSYYDQTFTYLAGLGIPVISQ
jgi:hypothetical protein